MKVPFPPQGGMTQGWGLLWCRSSEEGVSVNHTEGGGSVRTKEQNFPVPGSERGEAVSVLRAQETESNEARGEG